jgi:hypothetical protein
MIGAAIETKDGPHCGVIRNNGDYDVAKTGDLGKALTGCRAEFGGQFVRCLRAHVISSANDITLIPQTTGHVRAHPSNADKSNGVHMRGVLL